VGFFPSYYQHILVQKEAYPSHPLEGPANQKEEEEEEEKKNRSIQIETVLVFAKVRGIKFIIRRL